MRRNALFTFFLFCFFCHLDAQVLPIGEARSKSMGTEVTLTGIVTCDIIAHRYIRYFQDPTGGMAVYDRNFADAVKMGDSITITGVMKNYQALIELDPVRGYTIHSSGHSLPAPLPVTPGQLHDSIQGMLVQVKDVVFDQAGDVFSTGPYFYTSNRAQGRIYVHSNNALSGEPIPGGPVTLTGIASTYYTNHQVLVRHPDDLLPSGSIWMTSPIQVSHMTKEGFDLEWTTNIRGSTCLAYGHTPKLELDTLSGSGDSTWHRMSVSGAAPAELFYARALSVAGSDTAASAIRAYITASESGGSVWAFFNRAVDHSVSSGTDAICLDQSLDDTLVALINRAGYSIDLAIYSYHNSGIADITAALNNAHERGVRVRIVADYNTLEKDRWKTLDPAIGIIFSPKENFESGIGIMHNKFLIFDALSPDPDDPLVWTGSANITEDQLNHHANNVIIIQDRALALTYQLEFEEMFGSAGALPDATAARFGTGKKDNTPHELIIGGKRVECYFSPTDRTNRIIASLIHHADHELHVNTMLVTRDFLAEAIVERKDSGVLAQVIINDAEDPPENTYVMGILKDLGENFRQNGEGSILHHKTMIMDQGYPGSDPLVLTGSHNWSASADSRNDENTLVFHDDTLANIYYQEFSARFSKGEILGHTSIENQGTEQRQVLCIYPNPSHGSFTLVSPFPREKWASLELYSSDGRLVWFKRFWLPPGDHTIHLPFKPERGLYLLLLRNQEGTHRCLLISQ
jgi:phosphatidylserine/phosphatidylglycerophosphate/cardiolipin synthase-like enzyme